MRIENAILPHAPSALHTWTRPVPTLSQSDTDGANMRDVSGVARERYLLARWKPNAVNYTACLLNHFSPRKMAGQDKLVISRKQSIWKDDVLSPVRSHLPALWNGIMAGKYSDVQRVRGEVHVCRCRYSMFHGDCCSILLPPVLQPTACLFISFSHTWLIMSRFTNTVIPLLPCCCHRLSYLL